MPLTTIILVAGTAPWWSILLYSTDMLFTASMLQTLTDAKLSADATIKRGLA